MDIQKQTRSADGRKAKQDVLNIPELSVIIPTYNLEKEIGRCLKSVLSQGISDMEVIVVDDGSSDNTAEAVRKYAEKDARITFIPLPENRGVAAARNAALDVAKGEFIHFCDGDDAVPEGAYQEMLSIAREQEADLVTGNYSRMYPDEGGVIRQFSNYSAPTGKERCFESGNTMLWNKIYRRELIERNGIRYDPKLKYYEDFLFFHRVLLAKPVVAYTDKSIYIYTEPITRAVGDSIRYANVSCAEGLDTAWRYIFSSEIDEEDEKLWFQTYRWNLSWYYNYSWKMIQDPATRRTTFDILRALVRWVEENVEFCSWRSEPYASEFKGLFLMDYPAFCLIGYADYLKALALAAHIFPRTPIIPDEIKKVRDPAKHDEIVIQHARKQLAELDETFSAEKDNKRIWRENYLLLLDSLMNDYWREITDAKVKEDIFNTVKANVERYRRDNASCHISDTDILWRFKHIFCMDNPTLQEMDLSEYLMACATQFAIGGAPVVAAAPSAVDPASGFISACESGRIGMKAIIKAAMAWLKFKLRRNKR